MSATSPESDLAALITAREAETLDFKSEGDIQPDIAELMVAFANASGGLILFGATQDSQTRHIHLAGVSDGAYRPLCERIARAARHSVEPPILVEIADVHYEGQRFVLCQVPEGQDAVYQINGRVVQRQHDQNVTLRLPDIQRLASRRHLIEFERQPVAGTTLQDLSLPAVQTHLEAAAQHRTGHLPEGVAPVLPDPQSLLQARGCLNRHADGTLTPTVAGILMFGAHPDHFFDHAGISIAHFPGADTSQSYRNRWDLQDLRLPDLIDRAVAILWEHIAHAGIIPGVGTGWSGAAADSATVRQDQPEYPLPVLRELVANAVAHRAYDNQGSRIRISLFADRLELASPGGLAGHIALENILQEQYSRNPKIVRLLYERGYIEETGMGLDNVVRWLYTEGRPPALIQETGAGIIVTLPSPLANPAAFPPPQPNLVLIRPAAPVILTVGPPAPAPAVPPPTPAVPAAGRLQERHAAQQAILGYLAQHGASLFEELLTVSVGRAARTVQKDIADLVQRDLVRLTYVGRRSYYSLPDQIATQAAPYPLSLRQQRALTYAQEHGRITNAIYRTLDIGLPQAPPVARRTASNDLAELVAHGLLVARDKGRNLYYTQPGAPSPAASATEAALTE